MTSGRRPGPQSYCLQTLVVRYISSCSGKNAAKAKKYLVSTSKGEHREKVDTGVMFRHDVSVHPSLFCKWCFPIMNFELLTCCSLERVTLPFLSSLSKATHTVPTIHSSLATNLLFYISVISTCFARFTRGHRKRTNHYSRK